MNNEEKKEYLKSYKQLIDKIKSLEEQKTSIIETMVSAKAISYDDMPKSHNKTDLSDYIVRLETVMKDIDDKRIECFTKKLIIESAIVKIEDGIESDILRKKYIQFKAWETICTEIGYSWRETHRKHAKALNHLMLA